MNATSWECSRGAWGWVWGRWEMKWKSCNAAQHPLPPPSSACISCRQPGPRRWLAGTGSHAHHQMKHCTPYKGRTGDGWEKWLHSFTHWGIQISKSLHWKVECKKHPPPAWVMVWHMMGLNMVENLARTKQDSCCVTEQWCRPKIQAVLLFFIPPLLVWPPRSTEN